jgi:hypothetical protein
MATPDQILIEQLRAELRNKETHLHNMLAAAQRYKTKLEELRQALKAASDNSY